MQGFRPLYAGRATQDETSAAQNLSQNNKKITNMRQFT
jgi:hypothetical protein